MGIQAYSAWFKSICCHSPSYYILTFLGLGVCALAEFGRFLLYNVLVDGASAEDIVDSDDSLSEAPEIEFRGYKQMLLVLQSQQVETGKSFMSEVLLRIFHGKKIGLLSTLSFDSAKTLLGNGEPVVIGWLSKQLNYLFY